MFSIPRHLSSIACWLGRAALPYYFIYIYLLLFTDYYQLVHQLKTLEEVSVCWMVGLMLKCRPALSLLRACRELCPGGPGEDLEEDAFAAGHLHLSLTRWGRDSATARG